MYRNSQSRARGREHEVSCLRPRYTLTAPSGFTQVALRQREEMAPAPSFPHREYGEAGRGRPLQSQPSPAGSGRSHLIGDDLSERAPRRIFDGAAFTVTQPPQGWPASDGDRELLPFENPFPTPSGEWRVTNPATPTGWNQVEAKFCAEAQPEFAGLWISYLQSPIDPSAPGDCVLVVGFTDRIAEHRSTGLASSRSTEDRCAWPNASTR